MRKLIPRLILLITGICLGALASAQVSNTLFFMDGVPQSNRVNPAYQPKANLYIGIPFLAPARMEVSSSSLAYGDVIMAHPTEDSLMTFLHPLGDTKAFLKQMKARNVLATDLGSSLLSFGFRTELGYFSGDVSTRMDGHVYYPGDLAKLLINGNGKTGDVFELDGIGADLMAFDEIAVGWSYALSDELVIGARAKMLMGSANLSTISSDLTVRAYEDVWNIKSDMRFNASLPFAEVVYDEDGMIEEIIIDEDLQNPTPKDFPQYMFNMKNFGLGLDLGITYRPMDELLLSLSMVDLGYIRWKDAVQQVSYVTDYDYLGVELNPMDINDDFSLGDYMDSAFTQMGDSLAGYLEFTEGGVYSKRLNTKLFIGASYDLTPVVNLGLLSRTDFLDGKVTEQLTLSSNFKVAQFLDISLSYSYMNSYFRNLGLGLSFSAGPVNLYLISDNALDNLFWPTEARSSNLWLGLNLVFGYKEKPDLPLVQ